ncbi:MAG: diguanylate cyclase (GGDEF)-like protein [Glaciecola sp.]|jgi:diguanylate cyclase (GGDEF)-like protein
MNGTIELLNKQANNLATLVLAGLACLTNTYLVFSVFGSINMHFGITFVLLSLLTMGFRRSAIVLAVSLLPLLLFSEQIFVAGVQIAEYLAIAFMLKHKIRFLSAISLYCFLVGLPIVTLFIYFDLEVNIQTAVFVAFTFILSVYVGGFIALVCYWLLPLSSQHHGRDPAPPEFSKLVFELNAVSVILPVLLVTLFFVWRSAKDRDETLGYELNQAIQELNRSVLGLIDNKVQTLKATADILMSEKNPLLYGQILNTVATATGNVESMVLVDKNATVLIAAPQRYAAMLPELKDVNIAHRKYFQDTKGSGESIVSRAIRGRGLGDLDIVAITAPIFFESEFQGLVQAAIKLENLVDESLLNAIQNDQILILIKDDEDSIIYSSEALGLMQLDKFTAESSKHPFSNSKKAMQINQTSYIYDEYTNDRNWTIYTFTLSVRIFEGISAYFVFISVSILLSMLLITLLSKGLAAKITNPLLNLENFMAGKKKSSKMIAESKVSKEMQNVTENVIHYYNISEDFQRELKAQVEEKTEALQDLNEELLKLSQTDALTGLYNRGAFDTLAANTYKFCQRHEKPFTLVLFDIDYFKRINDNFGHVAGDACLVEVASLLKSKCRRETDILARYGGEEFILLLASDNHEQHNDYVNFIHQSIQEHKLMYNDNLIEMTVSVGVISVFNDFTKDLITLTSLADEQLYMSKEQGRDRVNFVDI